MNASSPDSARPMTTATSPPAWVIWTLRLLSIAAFAIAAYLAWTAFQMGSVAGCTSNGFWSCDHVLHSRWSKVLGIPVSLPASALYATLFASLLFVGRRAPERIRNLAWSLITALTIAAGLAAIWFTTLQVFVLKHLCPYCLTVHAIGLLLCLMVLVARPLPAKLTSGLAGIGVLATAMMMMVQLVTEPPPTHIIETYDQVAIDETPAEEVLDFSFDDEEFEIEFQTASDDRLNASSRASADENDSLRLGFDAASESTTPTSIEQPAAAPADVGVPITDTTQSEPPLSTLTPQPPVGGPVTSDEADDGQSEPVQTARRDVKQDTRRLVMYPGVRANLNVKQWPILGSSDAENVVVELFDYTCPHCREMNRHLEVARKRFGDQLAVVVLPVPLSMECNPSVRNQSRGHAEACEIAKLALAVWRVDPDVFPVFHRFLFDTNRSRSAAEARRYAETLVPANELRKQMQGALVDKFINRHVTLYMRAGEGTLPKILTEKMTIQGKMRSADELCRILQSRLGLTQ